MPRQTSLPLTLAVLAAAMASAVAQQPRDGVRLPARTGTAVLAGVVISSDSSARPIRRARVSVRSPALPMVLAGITDDEGRFRIERIPSGRYTVEAAKDAYLTTAFGAPRPGRPGTPIVLEDGRSQEVTLHLQRGSVLSGTVMDADGDPVIGANVIAHRYGYQASTGERVAAGTTGAPTDDRGMYRLFGLSPGDYLVSAAPTGPTMPQQVPSPGEIRRAMAQLAATQVPSLFFKRPGLPPPQDPVRRGLPPPSEPARTVVLAPVFHPGSARPAHAQTVTLGIAEERHGIDIQVEHVPVARVEGIVTGPAGTVRGVTVVLASADARGTSPGPGEWLRTISSDPQGRFRFANVPPGEYRLEARSLPMEGLPAGGWASATVLLDGEDVTGLSLGLQPSLTISGRLIFEGAPPPAALLAILTTSLPVRAASAGTLAPPLLQTAADGRFIITGLAPGPLRPLPALQGIRGPIGGWWLQSIVIEGREVLDAPLDIRRSATDAVITFANRASELSGTARDHEGRPIDSGFVIVFSASPPHWFPLSRRIAAVPLDAGGGYTVQNLPPGDYLVAIDADVEPGQWFDASYLGRVAGRAARVSLRPLEKGLHDPVAPGR